MPQDPYDQVIEKIAPAKRASRPPVSADPYDSVIEKIAPSATSTVTKQPDIVSALQSVTDNTSRITNRLMKRLPQSTPRSLAGTTTTPMRLRDNPVTGSVPNLQNIVTEARENPDPTAERNTAIRDKVISERYPTSMSGRIARNITRVTDNLNPLEAGYNLLRPETDIISEETNKRIEQADRANAPEMIAARKKFGALGSSTIPGLDKAAEFAANVSGVGPIAEAAGIPVGKTVDQVANARTLSSIPATLYSDVLKGGAGAIELADVSGLPTLARMVGVPVDKAKDWLNAKGNLFKEAQSNTPLDAAGKEIERSLPEKAGTMLGEMGVGIGELLLLKRATGLSMSKLMALETAAKTSDLPIRERAPKVAESAAMGRVLDGHLSRSASAGLFGVPTAVQSGTNYLQGNTSGADALLNTAIQAGTGALLGGKPEREAGVRPYAQPKDIEQQTSTMDRAVNSSPQTAEAAIPRTIETRASDVPVDATGDVRSVPVEAPHPSVNQPRRARNTEHGKRGQFKAGKIAEPSTTPDPVTANQQILSSPEFRTTLLGESIGGNAGVGRAAVNAVVDKDGRIVTLGNIQNLSPEIQDKLRSGQYASVGFVVKDVIGENPTIEQLAPHRGHPLSEQQRTTLEHSLASTTSEQEAKEVLGRVADRWKPGTKQDADIEEFNKEVKEAAQKRNEVSQSTGEPLTVYHGSTYSGTPTQSGDIGVHFSSTKEGAHGRGELLGKTKDWKVGRYQISLNNPVKLEYDPAEWRAYEVFDALPHSVREQLTRAGVTEDTLSEGQKGHIELRGHLKRLGYDGIQYDNGYEGGGESYVVFEPSQVYTSAEVNPKSLKASPEQSVQPGEEKTEPVTRVTAAPANIPESSVPFNQRPRNEGGEADSIGSGEPPAEPIPSEPASTTAAKRAKVTADREARGDKAIPRPEPKSDKQLHADAVEANAKDPTEPMRLIDQVLNGSHRLSDTEVVQVDLHRQDLKNKYDAVNKELDTATDSAKIQSLTDRSDSIERDMRASEEAHATSNTATARALRATQITVDDDFRLLSMVARRIKAKGGPLTTEERALIKDQHARIEKLEADLAASNERAVKAEAERAVDKIKRDVAKETRKVGRQQKAQSLDDELPHLKDLVAQAWKKVGKSTIQPMALDPEGELTKAIVNLARNRIKKNVGLKAEALVDEVHALIKDVIDDKRIIRDMISGYGRVSIPKEQAPEVKQLASIRSELKKLSAQEDIASGKRLSPQDKTRQTQLVKEEAELTRRMEQGDFSPKPKREPPRYTRETVELQKRVDAVKQAYARANYKATRGRFGMVTDELAKAANVPKTIKSMGDVSAMLRQGGFYALSHPINGLMKPTADMLRSFTEVGYKNVNEAIKNSPHFDLLKRMGVKFSGVEEANKHTEEGFFGGETIDTLATGKYNPIRAVKGVKNFSERTFNSFLDSQRMHIGNQMIDGLLEPGIIARTMGAKGRTIGEINKNALGKDFMRIGDLINSGTGRGSLGKYDNAAPFLNIFMFSPRLLKSRIDLLNNMWKPLVLRKMNPAVRAQMIKDNVKFLAATTAVMAAAQAAGGTVNRDPDDADFLKIRFGKTTYDTLTGLQQPLRYIINMTRAGLGGEDYPGKSAWEQTVGDGVHGGFLESKASPITSAVIEQIRGTDFTGKHRTKAERALDLITPLSANDFVQAMQKEGLVTGAIKASPSLTGVGVATYDDVPEPQTKAERLARKFKTENIPKKPRTSEQADLGKRVGELKTRARQGEDVSKELTELEGRISDKQAKDVLRSVGRTRFQDDFKGLSARQALIVYKVADAAKRAEVKDLLERKMSTKMASDPPDDEKADLIRRMKELGMEPTNGPAPPKPKTAPTPPSVKRPTSQRYVFQ